MEKENELMSEESVEMGIEREEEFIRPIIKKEKKKLIKSDGVRL